MQRQVGGRADEEPATRKGQLPNDAASIMEQWNREALASAWAELGSLSAEEAKAAGHATSGALIVGARLPAFQFIAGRQKVVARVVAELEGELSPRDILLWLTTSSGYLDGARPIDEIDANPDEVVAAARYQASLSWP